MNRNMKKVLLTAALAVAALPTMAQQVKYSVSGISDGNGKMIYLINQNNSSLIDSTAVAEGKFSFNGEADKDALICVRLKENGWTTPFFNDGTPITINLNDYTLKGSALNERLTAYDLEMSRPMTAFRTKLSTMTEDEIRQTPMSSIKSFRKYSMTRLFLSTRSSSMSATPSSLWLLPKCISMTTALRLSTSCNRRRWCSPIILR